MGLHKDKAALTERKEAGDPQSEPTQGTADDLGDAASSDDGDSGKKSREGKSKGEKKSFAHDFLSVLTSRVMTKGCQFLIGIVTARLVVENDDVNVDSSGCKLIGASMPAQSGFDWQECSLF